MRVPRVWRAQRQRMCLAAAAAALGITAFAWGANPPEDTDAGTGQVLPPTPSTVNVKFTGDTTAVQSQLGAKCDLSRPLPAIAMTVSGQTYQVATVRTSKCRSAWLRVDGSGATVTSRTEKKD